MTTLSTAIEQKKIDATYKLVDKLSIVAKGVNKELDNKLAKLRKLISGRASDEEVFELITQVLTRLQDFEREQSSSIREMETALINAGETLQEKQGLDADLRRKLRTIVNKLKSENFAVYNELQPFNLALLSIFQLALNTPTDTNSTALIENEVIDRLISNMESLTVNDFTAPSLKGFNERIRVATGNDQKLDICITYLERVLNQASEEYKQTQKLILNINTALESVHKTLVQSLNSSKDFSAKLTNLNENIDRQISELSKDATKASSVAQLQLVIDKKLAVITESLKQKEQIENKKTKELDSVLLVMESKLSKLEESTNFYRKKWLEEKNRSRIDALTGLPNRGAYDARFLDEVKRWQRTSSPLCLAILDIDNFKNINDKYGHTIGDKALKIVANTLRKELRSTDFLARYGGEEFACLLIDTNVQSATNPLEKLRKAVESIPFKVKNTSLNITISIGVTNIRESDNTHTVFERADRALYEAKEQGKNRICIKD